MRHTTKMTSKYVRRQQSKDRIEKQTAGGKRTKQVQEKGHRSG